MERRSDETNSAPRDHGVRSVTERPPCPPTRRRGGWPSSWRGWHTVALVGIMWSVCQAEAPLHPSLGLSEVAWRTLWLGGLCAAVGAGASLLRRGCRPAEGGGGTAMVVRSEMVAEQKNTHISWASRDPANPPDGGVSLSRALMDSLLLCVLQEPLSHPTLLHVEALLARLKAVSRTLQRAEGLSGACSALEDPALVEDVKTLNAYLQQRTRSLGSMLRAQGGLEAAVGVLLGGLELLWTQLVELHTRVTLTKDWSRAGLPGGGQGDLDSTKAEVERVSRAVGQYRARLQICQDHQRETTQLLQELTWSHTRLSARVRDGETVWPELLLQSNIEQFDKVQESFLSLEQQTSTFQAHLNGLERRAPDGQDSCSSSASSSSPRCAARIGPRHGEPAPASAATIPNAVTSLDKSNKAVSPLDEDDPQTLCERSALQFSSAFGRLRKPGRKK